MVEAKKALVTIASALIVAGQAITFRGPVWREFDHIGNTAVPNEIPAPSEIVELRWRRDISEDEFFKLMRKWGFDDEKAELLFNNAASLIDISTLVTLKRRGEIGQEEFDARAKELRLTNVRTKRIEQALEFRPGPGDIVRFAVREVFRDDIVAKFGMDEFFPTTSETEAIVGMSPKQRKGLVGTDRLIAQGLEIGMQPSTLRDFWRAHWELPSIGQAAEMFHRLNPDFEDEHPVDKETFTELLRTQDVMPFWIPRLEKILFVMPTRVDIRRMLRDGHITEQETFELYRKKGSTVLNATRLTNLAKSFYKQNERQLTRALVIKAFRFGELNEQEAIDLIIDMGFSTKDAELIVTLESIQLEESILEDGIDTNVELFKSGVIDETELISRLDDLAIASERRERIVNRATIKKVRKLRLPPKEDIQKFLKAELITDVEAVNLLKGLSFPERFADKYIELWGKK